MCTIIFSMDKKPSTDKTDFDDLKRNLKKNVQLKNSLGCKHLTFMLLIRKF